MRDWNQVIITQIRLATYVAADTGERFHHDRPSHGFVLNDENTKQNFIFEDGTVLHTQGNQLFYLPKGSSYRVESIQSGGCYAVNFLMQEDITTPPCAWSISHVDMVRDRYAQAAQMFREGVPYADTAIRRLLYDVLYRIQRIDHRSYMPSAKDQLLEPALTAIGQGYTNSDLTVAHLAQLCGISVTYLRRLFCDRFGVGPKEYMIERRLSYAARLLESGQFSVGEVAGMCGYAEPCHFSREFSRRFGSSPNEYKNARQRQ